MIKKFFKYTWSVRHEFAKYFFVGFSGVFLDIGTLALFKEKFGITPVAAVMLNQFIVMGYNFSLNKFWSFKNKEMPHKQIVRYLEVVVLNYSISISGMYVFNHIFGIYYLVARLILIVFMVPANFLLYKYWVYRVEIQNLDVKTQNNNSKL